MFDVRLNSKISINQVASSMGIPEDEVTRLEYKRKELTPELVKSYTEAVKSHVTKPTINDIKEFSVDVAHDFNL